MIIRKEATALSTAEQQRYITCVNTLLADPSNPYGKMVAMHADMSHNMHGGMHGPGTQRFLSWHRDYLLKFEAMIQRSPATTGSWIRGRRPQRNCGRSLRWAIRMLDAHMSYPSHSQTGGEVAIATNRQLKNTLR